MFDSIYMWVSWWSSSINYTELLKSETYTLWLVIHLCDIYDWQQKIMKNFFKSKEMWRRGLRLKKKKKENRSRFRVV